MMSTGNSDRTVTLPLAAKSAGRSIKAIKTDTGTGAVILDGNGSETINGATTQTIKGQYASMTVVCDGSSWYEIERPALGPLSFTATFTQTGGYSQASTVKYRSINSMVTIQMTDFTGTATATARLATASSTIPAAIRPTASAVWFPIIVRQNGAVQTTPGLLELDSDGTMQIWLTFAQANFTNGQTAGIGGGGTTLEFSYILD